jgi:hypothetical protein
LALLVTIATTTSGRLLYALVEITHTGRRFPARRSLYEKGT